MVRSQDHLDRRQRRRPRARRLNRSLPVIHRAGASREFRTAWRSNRLSTPSLSSLPDVTLSWSYFSDYSPFASFAKGLPVDPNSRTALNQRAPVGTDMSLSLGTFSTIRSQSNCYRIGNSALTSTPISSHTFPICRSGRCDWPVLRSFTFPRPGHCDIPSRVGGSCRRNSGCDYGVQLEEGRHFFAFVSDRQAYRDLRCQRPPPTAVDSTRRKPC